MNVTDSLVLLGCDRQFGFARVKCSSSQSVLGRAELKAIKTKTKPVNVSNGFDFKAQTQKSGPKTRSSEEQRH